MEKIDGKSFDVVEGNISKLKEIFPEVFTEKNQINFDKLRDILDYNDNVIDGGEEFYNFTWWGKKKSINDAKKSIRKTLRPYKIESKNWEDTENIYIEGDNLDAIKILLGSYRNSIKMIYIDPPYNTGKEFIYDDDFTETKKEHLENTGQLNEDGFLEQEANFTGKNHSGWLTRMYSRLLLSRKLLTDDGIIFISIDDNEVSNLKKICDEIYGEENFLAQIIVEGTPKNDPHIISTAHEYCLVYVKNFNVAKLSNYGLKNPIYAEINKIFEKGNNNFNLIEKNLKEFYENNDLRRDNIANYKFADEKGVFRTGPIDDPQNSGPKDERINPLTGTPCIIPNRGWSCSIETWNKWIDENLIYFPPKNDKIPAKKTYIQSDRLDVMKAYVKMQTRRDTDALKRLFGTEMTPFPNPKPVELLKMFIDNCNDENLIVCDFFSGSASTAEAVMRLNDEDGGNRNFILVQYPEEITLEGKTGKSKKIAKAAIDFLTKENKDLTIAEIGKERIRRIGDQINKESDRELDIGFKVFKVDESSFIPWNPIFNDSKEIEQSVLATANNIVEGRSELDLIYELLLKELNLDLNCSIDEEIINNHKIYVVDEGYALICLDSNIDESIAGDLLQLKEDLMTEHCEVILRDDAFNGNDEMAINIYNKLNSEGIEFKTI